LPEEVLVVDFSTGFSTAGFSVEVPESEEFSEEFAGLLAGSDESEEDLAVWGVLSLEFSGFR
jgi:hypothetical protein